MLIGCSTCVGGLVDSSDWPRSDDSGSFGRGGGGGSRLSSSVVAGVDGH